MYIIAWANMLADFFMTFACLQHMDMIKLRLGFGEFDLIFTVTAETVL